MKKPILFATLGYPGSGKTFFSRHFSKETKFFHLNSDYLRSELFPKPIYSAEETNSLFKAMDYIASALLSKGVSVVYDANSTRIVYRKRLQNIAKKNNARYVLLWFKTPVEIALQRIKKRSELKSHLMKKYHRPLEDWVLYKLKDEEEYPVKEMHIVLDSKLSYKEKRDIVLMFISKYK